MTYLQSSIIVMASIQKKTQKDTEREGERNGKQPKPLLFRHWPPHSTQDSRALPSLAASPPFLPPPAFLRSSPSICRLRPPPKLQPFPVLLGVYGLVRPGKQRSLFSLRCSLPCCWWCGFCPFLGVQCVPPPFLENAPRWGGGGLRCSRWGSAAWLPSPSVS